MTTTFFAFNVHFCTTLDPKHSNQGVACGAITGVLCLKFRGPFQVLLFCSASVMFPQALAKLSLRQANQLPLEGGVESPELDKFRKIF